ncbi:hypothetical protein Y032_0196g1532 [Ancylostoma ceylanicum]|uniref:Uncharacterized protein n=1 Tax=Ancylostoma ceylanicum TaxID=53326 RepID=A0A016SNQ4_9BILA|nr:hypothetical protein Y032_0196g1532 [Ancylostoma ceylanicum]
MTASTSFASWLVVAAILGASFYFYSNHKYLTYVKTADTFDPLYLLIPPIVMSSIMENDCKWPVLPAVDANLDNAVTRFRNIRCNAVMNPFAFLDEFGMLEVSRPVVGGDLFVETDITCSYQPLLNNSIGHVLLGTAVEVEFNRPTPIRHDQFVVQCRTAPPSQQLIYKKAFVNVPIASGPATEPKFAENSWEYPSLAVLVFDSVSANQFRRTMPQTMKFLVDNHFFTMNMYNEMTDDSNANILTILGGGRDPAETQTFLWDAMKERQCMTYLSEEVGDFPPILGNMSLDVEHDLRPFYAFSRETTDGHCTRDGRVASHEYLENWKNALLHSKERCHFSMHYMRTLTRDNPEYLSLLDLELRESLETLKANGLFEDTVFALVSGRGNPLRVKDQLFTARVEERSPLFSIKLPEKYLRKHFMERSNIGVNANRLTNTREVGLTLMDVALTSPSSEHHEQELEQIGNSSSLLRVVNEVYRSCDDAAIPPHLCLCMDEKPLLSEEYPSYSFEFLQLFEYVKAEALKNDCFEEVDLAKEHLHLTVLSLNPMVQHGIRKERDWTRLRKFHNDMGMNYVEITVEVRAVKRSIDSERIKLYARMRFRHTPMQGFEPVGTPIITWVSKRCLARRVEQFCEMCYHNRLMTDVDPSP